MVIAALAAWHEHHDTAAAGLDGVTALPAHVLLETYSVLTRQPGGLAPSGRDVARVLAARFPDAPLTLPTERRHRLLDVLSEAVVAGGAAYDGLVALEAGAHGHVLLTRDARAQSTYRRLGVAFEPLQTR